MHVTSLSARGFRNLGALKVDLTPGINLVWGPNGAGKTNLLEALYGALVGRSFRTRNDRETISFGEPLARAEAIVSDGDERRSFVASVVRDQGRHHRVDGAPVRAEHSSMRPAVAVFLPDRLVLVKGPPGARRAHLDRFCGALWPARAEARRRYARALAQRNALLGRVRAGSAPPGSLDAWDIELASAAVELIDARAEAASLLAPGFASAAKALGLEGEARLDYVPRSDARTVADLADDLGRRRGADIDRGHTAHGPHLDELALRIDRRPLRRYGSQGQQRVAVLALLFAEREALLGAGRPVPLMLLDDVTSELDRDRRGKLCEWLEGGGGQSLLTATEPDQLPAGRRREIPLRGGRVPEAVEAA